MRANDRMTSRRGDSSGIGWPSASSSAVALVIAGVDLSVIDAVDLSLHANRFCQARKLHRLDNYARAPERYGHLARSLNSLIYTIGSLLMSCLTAWGRHPPQPASRFWACFSHLIILRGRVKNDHPLLWGGCSTPTSVRPPTRSACDREPRVAAVLARQRHDIADPRHVWASIRRDPAVSCGSPDHTEELTRPRASTAHSPLAQFRFITIPMMQARSCRRHPATLQYFNMVTLIYVLTRGGPLAATQTLALRVLKDDLRNGTSARRALGLMLTLVNLYSAFSISGPATLLR